MFPIFPTVPELLAAADRPKPNRKNSFSSWKNSFRCKGYQRTPINLEEKLFFYPVGVGGGDPARVPENSFIAL